MKNIPTLWVCVNSTQGFSSTVTYDACVCLSETQEILPLLSSVIWFTETSDKLRFLKTSKYYCVLGALFSVYIRTIMFLTFSIFNTILVGNRFIITLPFADNR